MSRPKVKFCGITREEDALLAEKLGVDFVGFVFAPSERRVSLAQAKKISERLDSKIGRIGIFVDESLDTVVETADSVGLSGVQLHGRETSEYLKAIKAKRPDLLVIKSIEIDSEFGELENTKLESDCFLFDSPRNGSRREPFDVERLRAVRPSRPFFIAGGLNPSNVRERVEALDPFAVDVSSGIEIRPGIKSPDAMTHFMDALTGSTT